MLLMLSLPWVKAWLAGEVANTLGEVIGSKVEIDNVTINLFNSATVEGVTIYDQSGKKMLCLDRLDGTVEFFPLFEGRVNIDNLKIIKGEGIFYRKTSEDKPNYQFVLDSLAPKPDKKSKIQVNLYTVVTRDFKVKYDVLDKPYSDALVDVNHIDIEKLNSSIVLNSLDRKNLFVRVRNIDLSMKNGLCLNKLQCTLNTQDEGKSICLNLKKVDISSKPRNASLYVEDSKIVADIDKLKYNIVDAISLALLDCKASYGAYELLADIDVDKSKLVDPYMADVVLKSGGKTLLDAEVRSSDNSFAACNADLALNVTKPQIQELLRIFGQDLPQIPLLENTTSIAMEGKLEVGADKYVFNGTTKTDFYDGSEDIEVKGNTVTYNLNVKSLDLPVSFVGKKVYLANAELKGNASLRNHTIKELPHLALSALRDEIVADVEAKIGEAEYGDFRLSNVKLTANYAPDRLSTDFDVNDTKLKANGTALLENFSTGNLKTSLNIQHLDKNLLTSFGVATLPEVTGKVDAEIHNVFGTPDNFAFNVKDFTLNNANAANLYLRDASFVCEKKGDYSHYSLKGDGVTGDVVTNMLPEEIISVFKKKVSEHLPILFENNKMVGGNSSNDFCKFNLLVENSSLLSQFVKDVDIIEPVEISGFLDNSLNSASATVNAPLLSVKGEVVKGAKILVDSGSDSLYVTLTAHKDLGKYPVVFNSRMKCHGNNILSQLDLQHRNDIKTHATLNTIATLSRNVSGDVCANIDLLPAEVFIGDSLWNISQANFYISKKDLDINNLKIKHGSQYANLNARLGDIGSEKKFLLELNDVEVEYVLNMVNFHSVDFYGKASGLIQSQDISRNQNLIANLVVKDFYFNTGHLGTLYANGLLDNDEGRVMIDARTQREADDSTLINGYIDIRNKSLDINIKSEKTNAQFLNKYVGRFMADLEGTLSGRFHLYGTLKDVNMEADECVNYLQFRPKMLGVLYNFENDSIHLRHDTIDMTGMVLRDPIGNMAKIKGGVYHHYLRKFNYDINAYPHEFKMINWDDNQTRAFWGTVFADGHIRINGDTKDVMLSGELSTAGPKDYTTLYYNSEPAGSGESNNDYIHFVTKEEKNGIDETAEATKQTTTVDTSGDIKMSVDLTVKPEATLNIVTDPKTKDCMSLNGTGDIKVDYYNKGDFFLNGSFNVVGGSYKLTIKDIIQKNFAIQPEGFLRFNGRPSDGDLKLKGVHRINSVSLSDLNLGANQNNSTVAVDCILNFSGKASDPKVSFGLDFPNNSDESSLVKKLLAEEDVDMQAIYLLSIGRFYTYNYDSFNKSSGGQSQSTIAMTSFLAGTLSGQINSVLQDAFHLSNWNFGTNIAAGRMGINDMEVQGIVSGNLFNNRLQFNGNFGYRDQVTTYSNNFVGDFNLRWFLNKSGTISLNAYSETNDRYFTKSSLTTQGGGILFQKNFNRISELMRRK